MNPLRSARLAFDLLTAEGAAAAGRQALDRLAEHADRNSFTPSQDGPRDAAEGLAKYAKVTTYHVAKLSEFIGKLQETRDGDGTLLDRSLIYFGSGMGNGNAHDRNNPPVLMMGGANGRLKGNRHIAVEKKEPTANLLLAMADLAGADVEKIGLSTGKLSL